MPSGNKSAGGRMSMNLSLIAAASTNHVIGKNNKLLWHLPADLKYFKNTTWAMPVIMGRKTYESVGSKPLPGRFNFVVTRQKDWVAHSKKVKVASSVEQAVQLCEETDCKETFILGGGELYSASMSMANKIYLTRVHAILDGDTQFPLIDQREWQLISEIDFPMDEKHAFPYSFQIWVKK
jgi:dihydrofolate reductase